jgi:hypothetical protein
MTWGKTEIRQARQTPLAPILAQRGLQLSALPEENFRVAQYDDLVVKRSYWRWPSHGIEGNAIDFFMLVEGKSFSQAMRILAPIDEGAGPTPADRACGEPVEPANP